MSIVVHALFHFYKFSLYTANSNALFKLMKIIYAF